MEANQYVLADRPVSYTVQFACFKQGETVVTVALNTLTVRGIEWSFVKRCTGSALFEGVAIQGLNLGTKSGRADVIVDGITADPFKNAFSKDEQAQQRLHQFAPETSSATFYLSAVATLDLQPPLLVISYSCTRQGLPIADPSLSGPLAIAEKVGSGEELALTLVFGCQRNGTADISVEIPLKPAGALQFAVQKVCRVPPGFEPPAHKAEVPVKGLMAGLTRGAGNVLRDGVPQLAWHWQSDPRDLWVVPADQPFITFFLFGGKSLQQEVRVGAPKLISSLQVSQPEISGRGSEGGIVTLEPHDFLTVTVTFHCFANGTSEAALVVPLLPLRAGLAPPREEPLRISFFKECVQNQDLGVDGMGGVALPGFSISTSPGANDVVVNGFPRKLYTGQRNKRVPGWGPIVVSESLDVTTLFLNFSSVQGLAPQSLAETVSFQPPFVVVHGHECAPLLAGPAAAGGTPLSAFTPTF